MYLGTWERNFTRTKKHVGTNAACLHIELCGHSKNLVKGRCRVSGPVYFLQGYRVTTCKFNIYICIALYLYFRDCLYSPWGGFLTPRHHRVVLLLTTSTQATINAVWKHNYMTSIYTIKWYLFFVSSVLTTNMNTTFRVCVHIQRIRTLFIVTYPDPFRMPWYQSTEHGTTVAVNPYALWCSTLCSSLCFSAYRQILLSVPTMEPEEKNLEIPGILTVFPLFGTPSESKKNTRGHSTHPHRHRRIARGYHQRSCEYA